MPKSSEAGPKHLRKVVQATVDVPATTLLGLVLRASGRPQELAASWMQQAEAQAKELLESPGVATAEPDVQVTEVCELTDTDVVVNPLTTGEHTRYVGYMPVKLGAQEEVWWALVDTGAQVTVISAGLASYLGLYERDMRNVHPAGFSVAGYNDTSSYMPVLETRMRLGARGGDERWLTVHFCILDTNRYKLIVGVDLLNQLNFVYESPTRRLHLERAGVRFSLPLASKQYAFNAASITRYHQALD